MLEDDKVKDTQTTSNKEWSYHDKNEKKYAISEIRLLNSERFGEVLVITASYSFEIKRKIESKVVSPQTTYAVYLVYRLPQDQSTFKAPLEVDFGRFAYLVSPPDTPVIGSKLDENTHNTLNRPNKLKVVPQQRSDGWMEVKFWEFHTQTTMETISMDLKLTHPGYKDLSGLMVQGIEIRPI